jgi:hypothetical protein
VTVAYARSALALETAIIAVYHFRHSLYIVNHRITVGSLSSYHMQRRKWTVGVSIIAVWQSLAKWLYFCLKLTICVFFIS